MTSGCTLWIEKAEREVTAETAGETAHELSLNTTSEVAVFLDASNNAFGVVPK